MAEDNDLTMEDGPSGSKKMIIMIAAVILILLAVAGFFMFSSSSDSADAANADTEVSDSQNQPAEIEPASTGSAMYVTMPRPFTFNVPGTTRDRLVQIKVQLMVRGDNNHELAKRHIPLIEGTLLKAFSTANADDLATVAGKDAVKAKAIKDVQKAVFAVAGSKIIEDVLFTGFVMQ
ncbi:flagellar basal body-associated protein FliL [Psychrosphaera saromensis]|jgi:flagellar FliL protein|uniref:Flagellar protein FliL n=1 Tax=Psychrosphaera saromensis TaxID=716813 RepID=A0A2S7UUZ7_9GAMM|nr:flagellar basal body-associated protein FliL [Psychrosphaera saromensis]PQJ53777.1 flagellar basal body-associated protein FliL [Psychrosphaera saromensis]GHB62372.1 flagellar basal body-associated protein FliL [Psychrosphaera saromensis]GLQ15434.1 flagellar basal body-associated protein FliL [Psychrosphaera saromensis]